MNRVIVLTEFESIISKPSAPAGSKSRLRRRWQARLDEPNSPIVTGHSQTEALGLLVRELANRCDTADEIIDLVAGLFDSLTTRSADVAMGRTLSLALKHPRRRHAGAIITSRPLPAAKVKGGAA